MMETKKSIWDNFTNRYSLSKTLRFELKPVGKTLENIKKKNQIEEDKKIEEDFNKVKNIMNDYYRYFIETVLSDVAIEHERLQEFAEVYNKAKKDIKDEKLKKKLFDIQKKLRHDIYKSISKHKNFAKLFKKELIRDILPEWLKENSREEDAKITKKFFKWNSYFTGFFKNRKNIFSKDDKQTSMIHRIVNVNLPKFLDNASRIEKLSRYEKFDVSEIEKSFEKELCGKDIRSFFSVENYASFLNQKGIDNYNTIIGGLSEEHNIKIRGLNEHINELSQKEEDSSKKKNIRKLKLTPLYRQILSDKRPSSFVYEKFSNDEEVLAVIHKFYKESDKNIFSRLRELLKNIDEKDTEQIYVKNRGELTKISSSLLGDWEAINKALEEYAVNHLGIGSKKADSWLKKQRYIPLSIIEKSIEEKYADDEKEEKISDKIICSYFSSLSADEKDLIEAIKDNFRNIENIESGDKKELLKEDREKDVEKIKALMDSFMQLYHFIKPLYIDHKNENNKNTQEAYEKDPDFYNDFDELFEKFGEIIPLYNKIRNYVTQKPFSTKKFKLNFKNPTLLNGWDENKIKDNYSVILRKYNKEREDYDYYLAILTPDDKKIFREIEESDSDDCYEFVRYKLLPGPNKMLPKVFFSSKNIDYFSPSDEILRIRNHSTHTKNGEPQKGYEKRDFNIDDCHKFIDFLKKSLLKHDEWKNFGFELKRTEEYEDISEFYKDIADQGYGLEFKKIKSTIIDNLTDSGKLYLFQIWNKDFSGYSKGRKNLHTIYWENLFSDENLRDVVYKLNGEAEIFFRERSIRKPIIHKRDESIKNKNPIDGKTESTFKYDIIKDRRYSEDRFLFHCPITINFKAKGNDKIISREVNRHIQNSSHDINVIGIDRGERNLIYYTLLDKDGRIIAQKSLNRITDDRKRKFSYLEKLMRFEEKRDAARKNWKKIANIKELKEGYLSKVVHDIAKLAVENDAIIVLEDLNFGFKRGRFKIERQIYQKFEKALIEKLNYLMFKEKMSGAGSPLMAYQLSNKFDTFKKLGKQSGILFYVPASYTSKICPGTGFINMLWPKFENIAKAKKFFSKFDAIRYNTEDDLFEFRFRYSKMASENSNKKDVRLEKDEWTVCSYGKRLISFRNKDKNSNWDIKETDPTKDLKELFEKQDIEYMSGRDLKEDIVKQEEKKFFQELIRSLKNILMLRNSNNNTGEDYILSCVKDKKGEFFDSRKAGDDEPKDADANGAYHIGLKGIMLIDKIRKSDSDKPDLKISRNEFVNYVTGKRSK